DQGMAGKLFQHMIEETDTSLDVEPAATVEIDGNGNLCLFRLAAEIRRTPCLAGSHGLSFLPGTERLPSTSMAARLPVDCSQDRHGMEAFAFLDAPHTYARGRAPHVGAKRSFCI